jgi:hypothetical protein
MTNPKHEILEEMQKAKVKMQNDRAKFKNQFNKVFLHFVPIKSGLIFYL